jgi:hypothetical protein
MSKDDVDAPRHKPSESRLLIESRLGRVLGPYSEETFIKTECTPTSVTYRFAGYDVQFIVVEEPDGSKNMRPAQKAELFPRLEPEDLLQLKKMAEMDLKAYRPPKSHTPVTIGHYSAKLWFEGQEIYFYLKEEADGSTALHCNPKKPKGVTAVELTTLKQAAATYIKAHQRHKEEKKARKAEEKELRRKAEANRLMLERSQGNAIGAGSDALEKERQSGWDFPTPKNKTADDPPF